jgi:conjugal transfer/entry exclusion protein
MIASKKKIKAVSIAVSILLAIPSGIAVASGIPVVDMTNFAQNIITATKTTEELKAKYEEMRMNYMMLSNVKSGVQDVASVASYMKAMERELDGLYGSLTDARGIIDQRYRDYAASGALSLEEYYAMERKRAENNVGAARANYMRDRQVLNNLNEQYNKIQDLQHKIETSTGPLQQQQLLNSHMNVVATQTAQLLEIMAAREARANVESIDEEASREAFRKNLEKASDATVKAVEKNIEAAKQLGSTR